MLPFGPVTDPDDEYWPGAVRVTVSLPVALLPFGPVALPVCEQLPPAQLVSPACCTERPFGPYAVPELENWPGAVRVTVPELVPTRPHGFSTPPACEQLPPPHEPTCAP